jgi:arsenate reductase
LLDEKGIPYHYRDYVKNPLNEGEIREVLRKLGVPARDVLRTRNPMGLTGDEPEEELIAAMARQPNLLQRPIGILGERAVVGRPAERLLDLVD